jgi:alanine racemase
MLNNSQEELFMEALDKLRSAGYFPRWVHLGNSAAVFWTDNRILTAFRPGIAFYGYNPLNREDEASEKLQPALEVYSKIVSIQNVKAGDSVSYGEEYKAETDTQIAVIPFGYFEGLDRRLSNQAKLQVSGNEDFLATIAGKVCMNLTCLNILDNNVQVGDEVQVISSDKNAENSIDNLAYIMDTISYELLAKLNANTRKYIINLSNIKEK